MKQKLIADIRFFESLTPDSTLRMHSYLGELYKMGDSLLLLAAQRLVLKLREHQISLPDFDHIYLCLTPAFDEGVVQIADKPVDRHHPFYRFVYAGYPVDAFIKLSEQQKIDTIIRLAVQAVCLYQEVDAVKAVIEQAASYVLEYGEESELIFKQKTSETLVAQIVVQLKDDRNFYPVIRIMDHQGMLQKEVKIDRSFRFDELLFQFGSMKAGKRSITINPKQNFFSEKYKFEKLTYKI